MRVPTLVLWIGTLGAGALSCGPDPTGIIVDVQLRELRVDELRFEVSVAKVGASGGVSDSTERTLLVDPLGNGRVIGPFFGGGEETQPIVLDDSLDGRGVSCVVTGIVGDKAIAYGRNHARVLAHYFTSVDVSVELVSTPGPVPDASSDPVSDGGVSDVSAESTVGPPSSGSGGTTGTGGTGGMMPMSGSGGNGGGGSGGSNRDAGVPGTGGFGGSFPFPDGGAIDGLPAFKDNGSRCLIALECRSNHCVDGVCCVDGCQGACKTCNATDRAGSCVTVGVGTRDPRGICKDRGGTSCDTNGTCNANGGCALYPSGTVCIGASCQNKNDLLPASTCDGAGVCIDHPKEKCPKDTTCVTNACR